MATSDERPPYPPDWTDEVAIEDYMLAVCMESRDAGQVICAISCADYCHDAYQDGRRAPAPSPALCYEDFMDGPVQKKCARRAGHPGEHTPYMDTAPSPAPSGDEPVELRNLRSVLETCAVLPSSAFVDGIESGDLRAILRAWEADRAEIERLRSKYLDLGAMTAAQVKHLEAALAKREAAVDAARSYVNFDRASGSFDAQRSGRFTKLCRAVDALSELGKDKEE